MIESPEKADRREKEKARNPHDSWLFWLGWRDSNPRDDGVKVRCLTAWRQPNMGTRSLITRIKLRVYVWGG